MRALVSGQAGIAVLLDDEPLYAVAIDAPEERRPCAWGDLRTLFAETNDLAELADVTHQGAVAALELSWTKDRALQLTLMLLDPTTRPDTRAEAAECVEELFATAGVEEFVADRLYAAPLPLNESDLAGVMAIAGQAPTVDRILRTLRANQDRIAQLRRAWDELPEKLFATGRVDASQAIRSKSRAEEVLIELGAFRRLAQASSTTDREAMILWCLKAGADQHIPWRVVQEWTRSVQPSTEMAPRVVATGRENPNELVPQSLNTLFESAGSNDHFSSEAQKWEIESDPLALLDRLFPVRELDSTPTQSRQSQFYLIACARRAWARLPWVCRAVVEVAEQLAARQDVPPDVRATVTAAAEELIHCRGEPETVADIEAGLRTVGIVRPTGDDSPGAGTDPRTWTGLAYLAYAPFAGTAPNYRWVPADFHSAALVREVFGNPFRRCVVDPRWRTRTVLGMARTMYANQDFSPMPILADALEDAGCSDLVVLSHCRDHGEHVRGCWVLEGILRKERANERHEAEVAGLPDGRGGSGAETALPGRAAPP